MTPATEGNDEGSLGPRMDVLDRGQHVEACHFRHPQARHHDGHRLVAVLHAAKGRERGRRRRFDHDPVVAAVPAHEFRLKSITRFALVVHRQDDRWYPRRRHTLWVSYPLKLLVSTMRAAPSRPSGSTAGPSQVRQGCSVNIGDPY